ACSKQVQPGRNATTYRSGPALHVLRTCLDAQCNPESLAPVLGLQFDHPVCVPGEPTRRGIAALEPVYHGWWSCASATRLSFQAVEHWPAGDHFAVDVPVGLRAIDGARLLSPFHASLQSATPRVDAIVEVPFASPELRRSAHFIVDVNAAVALAAFE